MSVITTENENAKTAPGIISQKTTDLMQTFLDEVNTSGEFGDEPMIGIVSEAKIEDVEDTKLDDMKLDDDIKPTPSPRGCDNNPGITNHASTDSISISGFRPSIYRVKTDAPRIMVHETDVKTDKEIIIYNRTAAYENFDLNLPNNIPKSSIVYDGALNKDKHLSAFDKANLIVGKLYGKYIVSKADFELNLSSRLRKKMIDKLAMIQTLSIQETSHIFDEVVISMMKLMRDTFGRFKDTQLFEDYVRDSKPKSLSKNGKIRSI